MRREIVCSNSHVQKFIVVEALSAVVVVVVVVYVTRAA